VTSSDEDPLTGDLAESEGEWLTVCGKQVAYFQGPILWCEECFDRLREGEFPRVCEPWDSDLTPPEQRYEELLRIARVLLNVGITDEDKIVPTLAFAARFWEIPYFKHIRDRFIEVSKDGEGWAELKNRFTNAFGSLEALEVVDGVLIVGQVPTYVTNTINDETGIVEEITIDVYRRSIKPEDVARLYEKSLKLYGISNNTDRGDISWKVYPGCIRLMARPENRTIDLVGKYSVTTRPEKDQRPFPPAQVLESMYRGVRGSVGEKGPSGFAYVLGGKEKGPDAEPVNLISACAAWYVGDRGRLVERHELKPEVAKVLNEHLLRPCGIVGKYELSEEGWDSSQPIWRNIRKWSQEFLRVDHALREGTKVLGTYF
jgi:hypothetical protein